MDGSQSFTFSSGCDVLGARCAFHEPSLLRYGGFDERWAAPYTARV